MKKIVSLILCVILTFSCIVSVGAYSFSNNGTATKKATAYRLPSVNSGDVWWVDKNDKLQVFCQDGDYYLVLYPFNNTGKHVIAYVPTSAVSTSGVPSSSNFYKNEIVRTKSNANLYHNPSTDTLTGASGSNQTVRSTASKGQELTVLFEKDGFYCVRTSNDTGFIEKSKICTHSNVSKQKTSSSNATKINDASYHEIKITYKEVCNECGIIARENISETEKEKHSISNNKCTKCGYEVPIVEEKCNHSNTKENWQSSTVSQKSDTYHTVEEIYDVLCIDCGEALKKSQKKTYDEKHSLKNDECEKCSYVVPGSEASICKHKNTAKHSSDDMKTTISIKDDNQHTIASYYHVWCTDCFTYIKENELDLVHENHTFVNNICSVCNLEKIVDKPAATTLKVSKNSFTPGETISLNWAAAKGATTYDIHINKSGQSSRYRLDSGFTGTSGTLKINDEGTYTLTIYSVNSGGFTSGSSVTITVKKATTERAAWVVTDGRRLNFRKGPSTGYGVWYLLDPGTSVTVTGDAVSGFYPIKHNATTGYVSSDCLTFTKPATTTNNSNIIVNNSKTQQVRTKIAAMMNGTSYSGTYKIGNRYKGAGQCKGFAQLIFKNLFGGGINSTTPNAYGYKVNYNSNLVVHLGTLVNPTLSEVKSLLMKARPGDFIQMNYSQGSPHSAIVYETTSSGITVYEANIDGYNTISTAHRNWNYWDNKYAISLYTAKGY